MLTWWADHGKHCQNYEELEKEGRRVAALDNRPCVFPGNEWLFNAYLALDTCREYGMAVGPIPWLAVMQYGRDVLEMEQGDLNLFWLIIHRADTAIRAHKAESEGDK